MNLGTDPIVHVSHNCSFYLDLISKKNMKKMKELKTVVAFWYTVYRASTVSSLC